MIQKVQSEPKLLNLPNINSKSSVNLINEDKSLYATKQGNFKSVQRVSILSSNKEFDVEGNKETRDDDTPNMKHVMGVGK